MNNPANLSYTKSHEWLEELDNDTVRIGLTDFAQESLGDIVFVNLPQVGDEVVAGESLGDVESVKAVSDVFCPVSGTVLAVNEALLDALYGFDAEADSNTLEVFVSRLRRKLGREAIQTQRGLGYRLLTLDAPPAARVA